MGLGSDEDHQLHVLFFPFMAHGHMIPMIHIARLFSLRGLKTTIIMTPHFASAVSSKINAYQNSGLDIHTIIIPFPSEEVGLPKGCESIESFTSQDMSQKFFQAVAMLEPKFKCLVEDMHPDCIVSDMFLTWTTDVARRHGIPRLVFHGTGFFSLCVSDSLMRYSSQEVDTETFVVKGLPDLIEMKKSQMSSGFASDVRFVELIAQVREMEVASYGVLVNSFYELEPAYAEHYRKVMGRKAWHIGPVSLSDGNIVDKAHTGNKNFIDEHYYLNWLTSKDDNSVIYVSFGSLARLSCAQLTEIAEGLEASKVPFIWVVRPLRVEEEENKNFLPQGFEERMEGKGLVIRDWASQVLILDHPAIGGFLTHCGWNSILEGVSAGVPMITWPLFGDQFHNEALITHVLKIGMKAGADEWKSWVEPGDVSVRKENIEMVVTELMNGVQGEDMRRRAKGLKETAKKAVQEGGSSYSDLTALIQALHHPKT